MHQFVYSPVALIEYKDAVVWYKERSITAAEKFVKEIKEKINLICDSPFRYPETFKHFRESSLKKYPYSIVYFIEDSKRLVIITSVFHQKRNPERKYKK